MRNADVGEHAASGSPERRDPDRLLPADPRTRAIARDLYARVADAPIVSPHGHVPVDWLVRDIPFQDPASLLISHDHYITRLLHASGVDLGNLGVGGSPVDPRDAWRIVAERWSVFAGTASGYWLEEELAEVLGITEPLTAENADRIYDRIQQQLDTPEFRPRALFERFDAAELALDFQRTPKNGPSSSFFEELTGRKLDGPFRLTRPAFESACPSLYHRLKELPHA